MGNNTMETRHLPMTALNAGLPHILLSPADGGVLQMIARRPAIGEREVLEEAELSLAEGLVGDNWGTRGDLVMPKRTANPKAQLTLMNARVANLVAGTQDRWPLAGDQLYVDLDLSLDNLPAGTRLSIGSAVIEVTDEPHTGCKKFVERFGMPAMEFVNSPKGKQNCLRGINTRVVQAGKISVGDQIQKVSSIK
jgi:MOSC domain-containing protein YiiM